VVPPCRIVTELKTFVVTQMGEERRLGLKTNLRRASEQKMDKLSLSLRSGFLKNLFQMGSHCIHAHFESSCRMFQVFACGKKSRESGFRRRQVVKVPQNIFVSLLLRVRIAHEEGGNCAPLCG